MSAFNFTPAELSKIKLICKLFKAQKVWIDKIPYLPPKQNYQPNYQSTIIINQPIEDFKNVPYPAPQPKKRTADPAP